MQNASPMRKLATGVPGFDFVSDGGLPLGRSTLVTGSTGSGKTVFAAQFLAEGVRLGEKGIFVTFEESPEEIRRNMLGFGWDIAQWEKDGKWAFVDVSPRHDEQPIVVGEFELTALCARIQSAADRVGATRLSVDSLGAIFAQLENTNLVRRELLRLFLNIKRMGMTCVVTAERNSDSSGRLSTYGVEEFVADNVIIFRNSLQEESRRRTVEILKFRGHPHHKGEFPFTVLPDEGMVVIPLSSISLEQRSSDIRVTSGNEELDNMMSGGYFRDSVTLVSGATGTGKTLMVTEYLAGGVKNGERVLLFAFEESRDQLLRNAAGWGYDFRKMEADGQLRIVCAYPESRGLEDHLIAMKREIGEFKPGRLAVDSLSALERVSTLRAFRECVIGLTSFVKELCLTALFTSATTNLMGGGSVTEANISTITDAIILLRYVEIFGEMKRGVTVLKMRGSWHDKQIREYAVDNKGMHIGRAFKNVSGIIAGSQMAAINQEVDRIGRMFPPAAEGSSPRGGGPSSTEG